MKSNFFATAFSFVLMVLFSLGLNAQVITPVPVEINPAQVNAHVFSPTHLRGIMSDGLTAETFMSLTLRKLPVFRIQPQLDVEAFGKEFHAKIKDQVNGYAFQLRKNGAPAYTLIWNWAKTPVDGGKGWTLDTRMHIASVSKFMTAVAMVRLLDEKGISYDAKIANYLPAYWVKGPNINQISFRNLFTHTSGFSTGGSASDFLLMKSKVQQGINGVGGYGYENMNFGLCRVLLAVINGNINPNTNFGLMNDQIWDIISVNAYKTFVQAKVFTPAGVFNASFQPLANYPNALAYKFPIMNENGWDSGDLTSMAGGAAWRLSVNEVLQVMDHFRRKNTILPAAKAQMLLDSYFGIDQIIDTPAGKLYNKNGAWGNGAGQREQSVIYFLPGGMELVVFVNSKIGVQDASLRGLVKDLYLNNLQGN
jgi:CubicO group peptidase (beta-lactamase class C family)